MQMPTTEHWLVLMIVPVLALTDGCKQEGPAERAGKAIDDTVKDLQDTGEDLGKEIEDDCEDIKQNAGAEDTDC